MITFTITKTISDKELDEITGVVRDTLSDEIGSCLEYMDKRGDKALGLKIAIEIYERLKSEIEKMYKES